MAGLIAELAISGSRKSDGSVNSGGRVFLTEVAPSTTPVIGYTNRDKTASHTLSSGGILLDSAGKASIYTDEVCDIRVEDSAGATVATLTAAPVVSSELVEVFNSFHTGTKPDGTSAAGYRTWLDNVLTNLGTSLGGLDGLYKGAYGGTSRTIAAELDDIWFNAKRFGVVGDGNSDDTSFLQSVMTACGNAGGGVVNIPRGTFIVSSAINVPDNVIVRGAGQLATIIKNTNTGTAALNITGDAEIYDLAISHLTSSSSYALGHSTTSIGSLHVGRVTTSGHKFGVQGQGASSGLWVEKCRITTNAGDATTRGVVLAGNGDAGVIIGNVISAGSGFGIDLAGVIFPQATLIIGNKSSVTIGAGVTGGFFAGNQGSLTVALGASGICEVGNIWSSVTHNDSEGNFFGSPNIRPMAGYGYAVDVANGGNHTPNPWLAHSIKIRATSAGGGTVNTPDASFTPKHGHQMTIQFYNNSGGAFVWTLDAIYHVVAAPAPANGSTTIIPFVYDATRSIWSQSAASATVT